MKTDITMEAVRVLRRKQEHFGVFMTYSHPMHFTYDGPFEDNRTYIDENARSLEEVEEKLSGDICNYLENLGSLEWALGAFMGIVNRVTVHFKDGSKRYTKKQWLALCTEQRGY